MRWPSSRTIIDMNTDEVQALKETRDSWCPPYRTIRFGFAVKYLDHTPLKPHVAVISQLLECKAYLNEQYGFLLRGKSYFLNHSRLQPILKTLGDNPLSSPVLAVAMGNVKTEASDKSMLSVVRTMRSLNLRLGQPSTTRVYRLPGPKTSYLIDGGPVWFHNPVLTSFLTSLIRYAYNGHELYPIRRLFKDACLTGELSRMFQLSQQNKQGVLLFDRVFQPGLLSFFGGPEAPKEKNWGNNHEVGIQSWLLYIQGCHKGFPLPEGWTDHREVAQKLGL